MSDIINNLNKQNRMTMLDWICDDLCLLKTEDIIKVHGYIRGLLLTNNPLTTITGELINNHNKRCYYTYTSI